MHELSKYETNRKLHQSNLPIEYSSPRVLEYATHITSKLAEFKFNLLWIRKLTLNVC